MSLYTVFILKQLKLTLSYKFIFLRPCKDSYAIYFYSSRDVLCACIFKYYILHVIIIIIITPWVIFILLVFGIIIVVSLFRIIKAVN
jgi:hypothetical protein